MANEFVEANRNYFDEQAAKYETHPWQQKMSAQITEDIQNNLDFIGVNWVENNGEIRQVRLLDYACGTGLVSRALRDHITHAIGIDLSAKMVERFNQIARADKVPSQACRAIVGDLLTPEPPPELSSDPVFYDFDLAAVGLGFHHFENPALAVARLAERVKPGGVVLIIDFTDDSEFDAHGRAHADGERHGHHEHAHGQGFPEHALKTIKTHGFSEGGITEIFERAGLVGVGYKTMDGLVELKPEHGREFKRKVFLGRAEKPA